MKVTETFIDFVKTMLERMAAAGHRTVWASNSDRQFLVYVTLSPQRARRAVEVLNMQECLCDEDLGTMPGMTVLEDVDS